MSLFSWYILTRHSDTTATALLEIFILLAHYPAYILKIREEMDPTFASSNFSCQTAYPVLQSIINETMRLYPHALFASQRVTPAQDLQIGDMWIPENTVVYMLGWQLHHDARNFESPYEFVPERWTLNSEMVPNRSAFIPFVLGILPVPAGFEEG
jgi:cytochrome P450